MKTYLFMYSERISNILGSSNSSSILYNIRHYEIIYQPYINCLLENYVSFEEHLQVSPYPVPNHPDHRLNRLLKSHKYRKNKVYL